jgi:5-oxoprolinase (ATP-hydrolysing)
VGTLAAAFFISRVGMTDALAFEMGGTTAKASLILDGGCDIEGSMEAARVNRFKRGSGIPIKTPVVNMIEVGAGGGSIARIDEVGLLRVGPMSAGAAPGPVCYDKGGTEPTVTDANLVLGYYDPDFFLGGRMRLNADAAEKALAGIGTKLGLSAIETAQGIHRVVIETMAAAVRIHLVEKGRDPRRYAIVGLVAPARRMPLKWRASSAHARW